MAKLNLLAFSGSLRKASFNSGLVRAATELGVADFTITFVDISTLPLYNQDMEANFPAQITELKNQIRAADGILFASPEFNRSVSGVLKNMLDWTSRPYGDSAWDNKPVATMGASSGQISTALSQYHLKQIMLYLNCRVMGQPEFYVGLGATKFDDSGNLTDQKTKDKIVQLLAAFKKFIGEK